MSSKPVQALMEFAGEPSASLREREQCFELVIDREEVQLLVTVPKDVLEWFVNATDREEARKASDWSDYCGYDSTPMDELALQMAQDIRAVVRELIACPLRFRQQRGWFKTRDVLEWEHQGQWTDAVPMGEGWEPA